MTDVVEANINNKKKKSILKTKTISELSDPPCTRHMLRVPKRVQSAVRQTTVKDIRILSTTLAVKSRLRKGVNAAGVRRSLYARTCSKT